MNRRDSLKAISAAWAATALSITPAVAKTKPAVPTVLTTAGPVTGRTQNGVDIFLGLRYGRDTAKSRFQPPVKPEPWTIPQTADHYGPASPQGGTSDPYGQSEDCLFLNIWTPQASSEKRRPVMFYIHGGAYNNGSGGSPLYDGSHLALRGDVVVVTVNHRLNAFGYLYLARLERMLTGAPGPLASSGNCGQLDLHLVLEWVRDNIAFFGGDPDCIMVFGQSGGGAKIATMMATPSAKGLFHRAATMSGQQVTASGPDHAHKRTESFFAALGLKPDLDGLKQVQTLPYETLKKGLSGRDPIGLRNSIYFGPVLDETVLFRHPFWPDAPAQSHDIPMIIGNTHDETRGFLGGDPHNFELTWDELPPLVLAQLSSDIDPYIVIDTYRRLYPELSASDVYFASTTAGRSWRGAVEELNARATSGAVTYAYQLDWATPKDGGKLGAPHTLDIPLAFHNTGVADSLSTDAPEARQMADLVSDAFIAFARTGSPQTPALPVWEPYTLPKRQTLLFDLPAVLANDPRGAERDLFSKVPFIQYGS